MTKSVLVGWLPGLNVWFARHKNLHYSSGPNLDAILREVKGWGFVVMIDRDLSAKQVLQVAGACAFLDIQVVNEQGEVLKPTPVVEGKVRYITREELGRLIPDGWMIECQLDTYAACFGEELSFPARRKLELAIADIRSFLATSAVQNITDLQASIAAEPTLEQAVMDLGLVSSDRRVSAAADVVRRT